MLPRKVFAVLTTGLAVLSVASAVILGFQLLLTSVGDNSAARVLLVIGRLCLGLLTLDVLLLVGALGYQAMQRPDDPRG